jgi:hypothetical protein
MGNDVKKDADMVAIAIDRSLYKQLREYCDSVGIRFREFVEDSLENAFTMIEVDELRNEAVRLIERSDKDRKKSYRRGFWQGFCAAFFAAQGKMGMSLEVTPSELTAEQERYRSSSDGQLQLFDS